MIHNKGRTTVQVHLPGAAYAQGVAEGTRTDRRRARNRAAILAAAEREFSLEGLRNARIERIADAADVSVGSIYTHFSNKDGLYLAVVQWAAELFAEYMDLALGLDASPLERVMACGDAYLLFHIEHPGAFRFLAFDGVESRLATIDPEPSSGVTTRIQQIVGEFEQTIVEALDGGEIDPSLDPFLIARFLWGAWNGTVALSLRTDPSALSDEQVAACLEHARRFLVRGLSRPPDKAKTPATRLFYVSRDDAGGTTSPPLRVRQPGTTGSPTKKAAAKRRRTGPRPA